MKEAQPNTPESPLDLFLTFALVGFFAQLADSALGMGFGVISAPDLLAQGVPPPLVSASVNAAKAPTGIVAGRPMRSTAVSTRRCFYGWRWLSSRTA